MTTHRLSSILSVGLTLLVFGIGAALPAASAAKPRPRHVTHHKAVHHATSHKNSIPQHGGGDGDSDNFGGPSDGDGNV
jgi:hypothetical protein